jgi:uncharacterized protein involved in exopolysaccharide biosynthesis/Mrp family chromosome partitioning ATPase
MNPTRPSTSRQPAASPSPEFNLEILYFIFFRRWKLMLVFLLIGIGATWYLARHKPLLYSSESRVMIRFIIETRTVGPSGPNAPRVTSPDSRGENIMSSEMEILNSFDLAVKVAEKLGPQRILGKQRGGTNVMTAAAVIAQSLEVDNPKRSNIIRLVFTHPDPEVAQLVLNELVEAYRDKHIEIRKNGGPMGTWLTQQRDSLARDLEETESRLRELQSTNGIISIDESKRVLSEQVSRLTEELRATETLLVEARAMRAASGLAPAPTNSPVAGTTNIIVFGTDLVEEYRTLQAEEELLRRQEREALHRFTTAHPEVRRLHGLLEEAQKQMAELSSAHPGLAAAIAAVPQANPANKTTVVPEADPSRVPSLEAKAAALRTYLTDATHRVRDVLNVEVEIARLKRKKELQEANYKNYQSALDQVEADEAMGLGKVHNIEVVQSPSLPVAETKPRNRLLGIAFAAPTGLGIGLAVLLELVLNQRVRRTSDLKSKVSAPVFISIPEARRVAVTGEARKMLSGPRPTALPAPVEGARQVAVAGAQPPVEFPSLAIDELGLQPFFDSLQDRLSAFFAKTGMTHKPKLIGVTGCHASAGSTTVVSGLATALAALGEGNVLVVDMTRDGGTLHHFLSRKTEVGLSDALDTSKRGDAQVQENLFVVAEQGDNADVEGDIPPALRKRVLSLIPKLKLSDYDYILFDLPAMSQTSNAPRLGRLMDLVLLVAQGERTQVGVVQESAALLEDAGATVGVVLNRSRNHTPRALRRELDP